MTLTSYFDGIDAQRPLLAVKTAQKFLPSGPKAPSADQAVEKLFAGENVKFGNPVNRFTDDLIGTSAQTEQHLKSLSSALFLPQ